jgi:hypothetical protein
MRKTIFLLTLFAISVSVLLPKNSFAEGDKPAPLFELTSLQGDTIALPRLRGRFVVIHFAASW